MTLMTPDAVPGAAKPALDAGKSPGWWWLATEGGGRQMCRETEVAECPASWDTASRQGR